MNQNINLYHPIFRKQAKKFSAKAMLQAGAAVFAAIVLIYAYNLVQVGNLRTQLRQGEQQRDAAIKTLTEVTQKFSGLNKANPTQDEVTRLEREVAARHRLQQLLQQRNLGNADGYSDFLLAFARQHVAGVWLTHFNISGAGETILLEGRSTAPERVPLYMQKLSQEPRLAGTEFKLFHIARPDGQQKRNDAQYVDFRVGTLGADKDIPQEGVR